MTKPKDETPDLFDVEVFFRDSNAAPLEMDGVVGWTLVDGVYAFASPEGQVALVPLGAMMAARIMPQNAVDVNADLHDIFQDTEALEQAFQRWRESRRGATPPPTWGTFTLSPLYADLFAEWRAGR
jgi:hypothetical protein